MIKCIHIWNKEVKLSLFKEEMIPSVESPKESAKTNLLELKWVWEVLGYEINAYKSILCLYLSMKYIKIKFRKQFQSCLYTNRNIKGLCRRESVCSPWAGETTADDLGGLHLITWVLSREGRKAEQWIKRKQHKKDLILCFWPWRWRQGSWSQGQGQLLEASMALCWQSGGKWRSYLPTTVNSILPRHQMRVSQRASRHHGSLGTF